MGSPFASKTRKNPIHGMSMALHSSFSSSEIPPASSFREKASKVGHLKKLSGKGILTSGTWRDRYCLLVKTKLYFYENEKSEGTEKSCGFVNLEYFDTCTEATTRMTRKATNVFVIGSTEKGFFESHSGRHYFAAETVTEMKEWVNAINTAMNHIRGKEKRTRDGSLTPAPGLNKKESVNGKAKAKEEETNGTLPRSGDRLDHVTKGRVKGPQGRRLPRKSHLGRVSGISDSRPDTVDSLVDSDEDVRDIRGRATSLSALEASSTTHPNGKQQSISRLGSLSATDSGDRIDFDLSDTSPGVSSSSSPVNNKPDLNVTDENFEQAWFIRMPTPTLRHSGSAARGIDSDVDSTSDYSSMHGSPPSPKTTGSKRASKTPSNTANASSGNSFKSKFQKFICSLL